jgi:hypothetical protein
MKGGRKRIATVYVGEDGIKANVAYRLDEDAMFVEAMVATNEPSHER